MKDKRTEIIKELIKNSGLSQKAFAERAGVPYTTLRSMLDRGIGNASVDNVIKVCRGLGITTDELIEMADNNEMPGDKDTLPELNNKDEKDIEKEIEQIINNLNSNSSYAAFDGETLEDVDEEDRELLIDSLRTSLRFAKRMSKKKFTPNKYKN